MFRSLAIPAVGLLLASLSLTQPAWAGWTLQEAWKEAEAQSPILLLADEAVNEAATLRLQVLSSQLPRLHSRWGLAINQFEVLLPSELLVSQGIDSDLLPLVPQTQVQGSLTLHQPLLRPGLIPGMQSATSLFWAKQADRSRQAQVWRVQVASAFYALLVSRAAQDFSDLALQFAEEGIALAQNEMDRGLSTQRVVLQARIALSRARRESLAQQEAVEAAEQAWRSVTGLEAKAELDWPDLPPPPTQNEEEQGLSPTERPDVKAADLRVTAARSHRTSQNLSWLPAIDFAFEQRFRPTPSLLDPYPYSFQAGFQLNWSLFDGGLRIAQSRKNRARLRMAEIEALRLKRQARDESKTMEKALARAEANLRALEDELALAQEDRTLAEKALESGGGTEREVKAALLAEARAKLEGLESRKDRDLALLNLLLALGKL